MPKINATPIYSGEELWDKVVSGEFDYEVLSRNTATVMIRVFITSSESNVITVPTILWNTYMKAKSRK